MKIESEVARLSRYGDDALEGFYTAVDNGQARLAMTILVDVISAFAEKIDSLEEALGNSNEEVKPADIKVEAEKEEVEIIKPEPKAKVTSKEVTSKDSVAE
jgi:hypothetical protein